MTIFFKDNQPFVEGVCINDLINSQATPFYIYSQEAITATYHKLKKALSSEIFFSVKANSNQAILKLMQSLGAGADTVSIGELERAVLAGFDPSKIIFEGVGKSQQDIEFAIQHNIRLINVESLEELQLINQLGQSLNKIINISVRLNPDIDGLTLDKISTGKKTDKFGITLDQLTEVIQLVQSSHHVNLKGISCHIGSQIYDIAIFEKVFTRMKKTASLILSYNIQINYVDLGGGFGVNYDDKTNELDITSINKLVHSIFDKEPYEISFEPGRYLIARAGIIITKILTRKKNGGIHYLITDAGMQTLIRPALYNIVHRVTALQNNSVHNDVYTVAGPICESSDIIAKDISLPDQQMGNHLVIHDTGAYGAVMASNYNSRGFPAEILIHKEKYFIIHHPEKITDIIKRDHIPSWL